VSHCAEDGVVGMSYYATSHWCPNVLGASDVQLCWEPACC